MRRRCGCQEDRYTQLLNDKIGRAIVCSHSVCLGAVRSLVASVLSCIKLRNYPISIFLLRLSLYLWQLILLFPPLQITVTSLRLATRIIGRYI